MLDYKNNEKLDSYHYWTNQIKESQKQQEYKDWQQESKAAWNEFLAKNHQGQFFRSQIYHKNHYPMYWSDTSTLLPAIYSHIPKIIVKQRFSTNDPIARTACLLAERLGNYLLETSDFDSVIQAAALEYLNTNRVTTRIFYEAEIKNKIKRIPVYEQILQIDPETQQPLPEPITIYVTEQNIQIDEKEVMTNEEGEMFIEEKGQEEEITYEAIKLASLSYADCLISPHAKNESDIWWIAYKLQISKTEAKKRFKEKADNLTTKPDSNEIEIWEIWCKRNKKIYWLSLNNYNDFLDIQNDIYELDKFFPSPSFCIADKPLNSFYPIPEFTQTFFLYNQLHILSGRIEKLSRAIKSRYVFNGAIPELQNLASETYEAEGIGVADWAQFAEKGGIKGNVDWFPVDDLVRSLVSCQELFERYKNQLYELRGIPDVIRGASDVQETAFAQRLKSRYASLRFSVKQRSFANFIANNIRIMLDLALETFSNETISKVVGLKTMDIEDQERFNAALLLLRNDFDRNIRVDIETDSTVLWVEEEQKQLKAETLQAVSSFVAEISGLIKQDPNFAAPLTSLLYSYIRDLRQGKEIEDEVTTSFNQLLEQLNTPPEPPPEDPNQQAEQMKLEATKIEAQAMLIKAQTELQKAQLNSEIAQLELQIKQEALTVEREKLAVEYQKLGANVEREKIKADAEQFKAEALMQKEAIDTEQARIKAEADTIKAQNQIINSYA